MRLMKWLSFVCLILLLSACAPEGMSQKFYNQAQEIFAEIDDDVAEQERSDQDDLLNLNLLEEEANSSKEKAVVNLIQQMVSLQEKVIQGDQNAIRQYLDVREDYFEIMELPEKEFKFVEDDDYHYDEDKY